MTFLRQLDSQRVGRQRKEINQKMRSLKENISQLEIDLKAKGSVQDASRIEEFMGTLA